MNQQERENAQSQFQKGKLPVMTATLAFGMGIDIPDIRMVLHLQCSGSLEAYYQETGRGGRDGSDVQCLLMYSYADLKLQETLIRRGGLKGAALLARLGALRAMQNYATRQRCRQQTILDYFGEASPICGNCDICLGNHEHVKRIILHRFNAEEREIVMRSVTRLPGLIGIGKWDTVFRGRPAGTMAKYPWQQMDFFGAFNHLTSQKIREGLKRMLEENDLSLRDGRYPRLTLPSKPRHISFREAFGLKKTGPKPMPGMRSPTEEIRRLLRNFIGREGRARNMKPFMVLTRESMKCIGRDKPRSLEELEKIPGIGARKLSWIGKEILEIVEAGLKGEGEKGLSP